MKKGLLIIGIILGLYCAVGYVECNYTRHDCVAVSASPTGVIFEDGCGYTWYWEESGFEVGDVVDLKMFTNCTDEDIDDDEIKKVVRVD